jgi:hypothetical protein
VERWIGGVHEVRRFDFRIIEPSARRLLKPDYSRPSISHLAGALRLWRAFLQNRAVFAARFCIHDPPSDQICLTTKNFFRKTRIITNTDSMTEKSDLFVPAGSWSAFRDSSLAGSAIPPIGNG